MTLLFKAQSINYDSPKRIENGSPRRNDSPRRIEDDSPRRIEDNSPRRIEDDSPRRNQVFRKRTGVNTTGKTAHIDCYIRTKKVTVEKKNSKIDKSEFGFCKILRRQRKFNGEVDN